LNEKSDPTLQTPPGRKRSKRLVNCVYGGALRMPAKHADYGVELLGRKRWRH
jgi:hypothetical protein